MIIQIDEQYRVTTDPYQWIIQKKHSRKDKEDWESQTYHPSLDAAIHSLWEYLVRASDAETEADALQDIERITTRFSQALAPHSESILKAMAKEHR